MVYARSVSSDALTRVGEELLRLHAEARALGQHQVAYHALAAVLHAAEGLREQALLDRVETTAREYGASIDQDDPRHPLSSQSASTRGHTSIFQQLAATAAAVRVRLKAEALTRK